MALNSKNGFWQVEVLSLVVLYSAGLFAAGEGEGAYRAVEWTDLLPEEDLTALMNPPEYLEEIADGSEEDVLASPMRANLDPEAGRYQQALTSTGVRSEFDGRAVRIPGFIVPLAFDEKRRVTHFFLVPFFGACIHVPPPPPNQIIYAVSDKGIEQRSLYDAYWVFGRLATTLTENDMATSAYAMEVVTIELYRE